jgi:hypothetical protein
MLTWYWVIAALVGVLIILNARRIYREYSADHNRMKVFISGAPLVILAGLLLYVNQNVFDFATQVIDNDLVTPSTPLIWRGHHGLISVWHRTPQGLHRVTVSR